MSGTPKGLSSTISLRYCPECRRDDRVIHLGTRHFRDGKLCPGDVRVAVYRFDRLQPLPKMDRL
jgi:hypothetical protein